MSNPFRSRAPLCIAHRGARSLAPENTLAALAMAARCGAQAWECDVRLCADGHLVLMHDQTLARTTDVALRQEFAHWRPWRVSDFTLAELQTLDAGSWFLEQDPFGQISLGAVPAEILAASRGERIPTLRQALERSKGLGLAINVEIKDMDAENGGDNGALLVGGCLELLRETGMLGAALVSSFNPDSLRRARAACPEILLGLIVEAVPRDAVQLLHDLGVQALHPCIEGLEPSVVRGMRKAGFLVNVWTVNDVTAMRDYATAGANGLITDWPQRCPASGDLSAPLNRFV
jgi:glycerophosphoryl diester phosphodiesterase